MFKQEKGVTLIALVITIIVLLILAAVSIAMLSGDNGILNNATRARAASAIADAKSAIATEIANYTTQYYVEQYTTTEEGELDAGALAGYLDEKSATIAKAAETAAGGDKVVTVSYGNDDTFTIKYYNNDNYSSQSSAITYDADEDETIINSNYLTWTDSDKLQGK